MSIDEVWEDPPKDAAPPQRRARSAIHDDIVQCDQDLLDIQSKLDAQHEKRRPDKAALKQLRKQRDAGQEHMIEFYRADPKPSVEHVRSKNRSFSVVRYMPQEWVKSLEEYKDKMRDLSRELRTQLDAWDKKHDDHELLKLELMKFTSELE